MLGILGGLLEEILGKPAREISYKTHQRTSYTISAGITGAFSCKNMKQKFWSNASDNH